MPAQANRHSLDFISAKKVHLPVYVVYVSRTKTTYSPKEVLHCVCKGLFSAQKIGTPADSVMLAKASCVNLYFL